MAAVDRLIDASVLAVKNSGLLERVARMAIVSVVNSNGTLDVTRNGDTFASVRMVGVFDVPAVGESVLILRGMAGWYCLGRLRANSLPRIQRGSAVTPGSGGTAGTWTAVNVTFDKPFASTPTVVATPVSAVSAGTTEINWSTNSITTTGFELRSRRTTDSITTFGWIATDI
ncbi:H-type lectin domain-containing protein [Streptomyces sp. R08]|uniref:H-type lectin domain-containing protein n=1 Tax=Streptomyces sp. R08 TaxID=3238624 RepID=A0AB39MF85_9ACTN